MEFTALFDSGTSFTYLIDPTYQRLSESFHSHIRDRRRPPDSRIPFEFCYDMSSDANTSSTPSMGLTMRGGSHFSVYDPIIIISTQSELVYCLAVVKSTELNIIGQNFMTGYRVVFDREKLILGWKKFDCYDVEDQVPAKPHSNNVPPAVAAGVGIGNHSAPKSTTKTRTDSQRSRASPSQFSLQSHFTSVFLWISLFPFFFLGYVVYDHPFV